MPARSGRIARPTYNESSIHVLRWSEPMNDCGEKSGLNFAAKASIMFTVEFLTGVLSMTERAATR